MPSPPSPAALPAQPFFALPGQRVGLARERFFADGQRPTGLVSEAVIQSWARCLGARRNPRERVAFDPVTRSRLHATLARNEPLLRAAGAEIEHLEAALGGTGCRVILTDGDGVIVHATPGPSHGGVLPRCARVGVNLAESSVGTNALAVVVKTGAPVTVHGAEHYFDDVGSLYCAGAPIRDGCGRVAGVLDLTLESRGFGFDAAALVGVYATAIENRLLLAGAREHLVLRFQVTASLLGSPLEALAGIAADGRVVWLNSTAQQLLGLDNHARDAERLFGEMVETLLARAQGGVAPLRLPNGLTVLASARLAGPAPLRTAVRALPTAPAPAPAAVAAAPAPDPGPLPGANASSGATATLGQHTREVIERALADCQGNVSRAARRLGVSRGLLYRRLREGLARGA